MSDNVCPNCNQTLYKIIAHSNSIACIRALTEKIQELECRVRDLESKEDARSFSEKWGDEY
jgi:polyhydroxyalkanoate synthesis regulator phasin